MAEETSSLDKIASVLGMILTKDMNTTEKVGTLNSCGFSVKDMARMIGTTENVVYARLSDSRKKPAEKSTPKKKPSGG